MTFRTEAIDRALAEAFPHHAIEDLRPLHGGRSGATLLSFGAGGDHYVLRQPDPRRFRHDARTEREIVCMMHASERGIAPKVHWIDRRSNIVIMEKIEPARLGRRSPAAPDYAERLERLTRTLRALHEAPHPSFDGAMTIVEFVHALDHTLREQGGGGLPASLLETLNELVLPMKRFSATALCHNDLNPGNVLETADRVYFVDWEAASISDPFFDLGSLSVFSFPTQSGRDDLLNAYLGREPSQEEKDRATLARMTALGFCAATFIHLNVLTNGSTLLPPGFPMLALLSKMGDPNGPPEAGVIGSSLLGTMLEERSAESYPSAIRRLTESAR